MRGYQTTITTILAALIGLSAAQGADPSYLQQYYQQVAAQAGRAAAGASHEATPIFESNSDLSHQYSQPGHQLRLKDNAQDQVRSQQQQTPQHTQAYVAPSVRQYLQQPQSQQIQYVAQPQPIAYKPAPAKQNLIRRPEPQYEAQQQGGKFNKENPEDYDHNPSYQFGFDVKDDEFTNYQNRKESREGDVIKGSYSVVDSDGFIRTVKYTADPKEGFKAEVIREPTDIVVKFPTPAPQTQLVQQSQHHQPQQYLRQAPSQQQQQQYRQEKAPQPQYQYQQ